MLPEPRRSNPLRFCSRYSIVDGTKKLSAPSAPNSGYWRASSAVNTSGAPPDASAGPSTAATVPASASSANQIRGVSSRGRRRDQPTEETSSTPVASSAAVG